jgi:beta-N-acetylhexosaminidase
LISIVVVGCNGDIGAASPAPLDSGPTPAAGPTSAPTPAVAASPTVVPAPTAAAPTAVAPSLARLIGQKLVVKMQGTTPSADLLSRIRHGQIGGLILFASNITTPAALDALTAGLQDVAAAGGQPPLLIATDQEGGTVDRIPWAPPTLSPPQMGAIGLTKTAHDQGVATGRALRGLGINCDLAPVADVPGSTASFMYQEGRTWSFDPALTTALSNSFARGLWSAGDVPVMKHFPGIGLATLDTDSSVVTLTATKARLAAGLQPYLAAIAHSMPMIMLSNATYAAFDPRNGAGWSRVIVKGLLRDQLGFQGVTITDSLSGTARTRAIPVAELAVRAAIAGTDMILLTGSEAASDATYDLLLAKARAATIPQARLLASYDRILALKASL